MQAYTIALAGILPTTTEEGFPQIVMSSWFGLVARAGAPPDRIIATLNASLAEPETVARLLAAGLDVEPSPDPDVFATTIRQDFTLWDEVARRGNLRR